MKKWKFYIIACAIISCSFSCSNKQSLPNNFETRIIGDWVVKPNSRANTFIMFRLNNLMDCCTVFHFKQDHQFKPDWLNKKDTILFMRCGNALSYSESSNWEIDIENNFIIDNIQYAIEEKTEVKKSYRVYEFKHDTFILQLNKVLVNSLTNLRTGKSYDYDSIMKIHIKQYLK